MITLSSEQLELLEETYKANFESKLSHNHWIADSGRPSRQKELVKKTLLRSPETFTQCDGRWSLTRGQHGLEGKRGKEILTINEICSRVAAAWLAVRKYKIQEQFNEDFRGEHEGVLVDELRFIVNFIENDLGYISSKGSRYKIKETAGNGSMDPVSPKLASPPAHDLEVDQSNRKRASSSFSAIQYPVEEQQFRLFHMTIGEKGS